MVTGTMHARRTAVASAGSAKAAAFARTRGVTTMVWRAIAACCCAASCVATVEAGVVTPESFTIDSFTTGGGFTEDLMIASYEFGTTNWLDAIDDGMPADLRITVHSGASSLAGFDFAVTFDYALYALGDFGMDGFHRMSLNDVYGGAPLIASVLATDATGAEIDGVVTDGGGIVLETTTGRLMDGGEFVTIHFSVVPAPGALASIAAASVVVRRRRR